MSAEPQKHQPETRPAFKFLAGFFGILFLIAGCTALIFAFHSTGSAVWRWAVEASLFLFLGTGFVHAAFTGRWGLRR
jgi:hypothetical protein